MRLPTQLTVLRIALVPVFYVLFAVVQPAEVTWAVVVFVVAALTDWYDGYFARLLNHVTPLGAFLDPLADKLLTSSAFVAFAARGLIPWWMVLLVIARDIYLTLFRMSADSVGMTVRTSFFAKVKTFVQMAFIGIVLLALASLDWHIAGTTSFAIHATSTEALYWMMLVVTLLTFLSAVEYTYDNWRVFRALGRRYIVPGSTPEL
jgi:CDP-diacylglycerol--glycerol-3-phosphate 3-phosphatidyltransferase